MLHLIFQSTFDNALLHRIESGDDVVFFENAIFRLIEGSVFSVELQKMRQRNIHLHVLTCDIETRGIESGEITAGIEVIDYPGLVELTEKSRVIRTWS